MVYNFIIMSIKQELYDIRTYLMSEKFDGILFPLTPLENFFATYRIKCLYNYSVNAMMLFSLALANLTLGDPQLLDELQFEDQSMQLGVDEAARDAAKQQQLYNDAPEDQKYKFSNPSQSRSPHTVGGAVDLILAFDHKYAPLNKDLCRKAPNSPEWIPKDEQDKIKTEWFVHYHGEEWAPLLKNNAFHESSHAKLTLEGWKRSDAIDALFNTYYYNTLLSGMPFLTPINDEYWHFQLRNCNAHPIVFQKDFDAMFGDDSKSEDPDVAKKQSENRAARDAKASEIISLAYDMAQKPIYYNFAITPGQRIQITKDYNIEPETESKAEFFARLKAIKLKKYDLLRIMLAQQTEIYSASRLRE